MLLGTDAPLCQAFQPLMPEAQTHEGERRLRWQVLDSAGRGRAE